MSDVVIRVDGLSKLYRIRQRERYKALRDTLTEAIYARFRWLSSNDHQKSRVNECIWALKDVSFEVKQGQVVGIIGQNGAGKSTLLKILSRITDPTEGHAEIRGRVGSLLEVGTGFHPELTGRENIYLNGAILGMNKAEIDRRFDEIVAFAEVEKFIDTPVKRYSSGMYVRLAFAVAAHLEPEILLVDEVLSVGDASFQKKCLGKMGDVVKRGRTVLFVSHNMAAITALTQRCLLIGRGRVIADGDALFVTSQYLAAGIENNKEGIIDLAEALRGSRAERLGHLRLVELRMLNKTGESTAQFRENEPIRFELSFEVTRPVDQLGLTLTVTARGVRLFSIVSGKRVWHPEAGTYTVSAAISPNYLRPGIYNISLGIDSSVWQDGGYDVASFEVIGTPHEINKRLPTYGDFGILHFGYDWGDPVRTGDLPRLTTSTL